MELKRLKDLVYKNGIVGAGGAGFPTQAKLNNKTDKVILNGCECEPLLQVDKQLLSIYSENILRALSLIVETVGANEGIVAVKQSNKNAISVLMCIIERFPKLSIKRIQDFYPAGDEVVLVYETTGRIVPEAGIPMDVNVVVMNTETVLNIYNAVFLEKPVIETYVTIVGEVNTPMTLKVPIGTAVSKVIEFAGGTKIKDYKIIMGGPMTGKIVDKQDAIVKTTKAVIVLPQEHPIIIKKQIKTSINMKRAMAVCSQCQMCTDLCPRFLLGHSIKPHRIMNSLANGLTSDLQAYTSSTLCSECGLCQIYSCYQGLSPSSLIGELKRKLKQNGVKNSPNNRLDVVSHMREYRKVPKERLIARLSLSNYNVEAPLNEEVPRVYRVNIPLIQHIGVSATPIVKVGDGVEKGQLIATVEEGKLGAKMHASIDGVIKNINEKSIIIETRGDFHG